MIIYLNEQYRLTSEPLNIMLEEKKIVKEGKNAGQTRWNTIGYYSNLEQAVSNVFKRQIQTSEIEGIQNIIDEIKTATKTLCTAIRVESEGLK
ncbi:MAG: DUF5405 family protein [Caulobacteraceae bacterium]